MTGQYSHVHGIRTLDGALEPARQYLAHGMRAAGYETAMVGKWHLGAEPAFVYYRVLPGQGSCFNPVLREEGNGTWPDNERRFSGYDSAHSSDVITDVSIEWLRRRHSRRNMGHHMFVDPSLDDEAYPALQELARR